MTNAPGYPLWKSGLWIILFWMASVFCGTTSQKALFETQTLDGFWASVAGTLISLAILIFGARDAHRHQNRVIEIVLVASAVLYGAIFLCSLGALVALTLP